MYLNCMLLTPLPASPCLHSLTLLNNAANRKKQACLCTVSHGLCCPHFDMPLFSLHTASFTQFAPGFQSKQVRNTMRIGPGNTYQFSFPLEDEILKSEKLKLFFKSCIFCWWDKLITGHFSWLFCYFSIFLHRFLLKWRTEKQKIDKFLVSSVRCSKLLPQLPPPWIFWCVLSRTHLVYPETVGFISLHAAAFHTMLTLATSDSYLANMVNYDFF